MFESVLIHIILISLDLISAPPGHERSRNHTNPPEMTTREELVSCHTEGGAANQEDRNENDDGSNHGSKPLVRDLVDSFAFALL